MVPIFVVALMLKIKAKSHNKGYFNFLLLCNKPSQDIMVSMIHLPSINNIIFVNYSSVENT